MSGARLVVDEVTRAFGDTVAVDGLSLALEPGSFTALLGPSGCGKSTLLSLVAGLQHPDRGDITLDGESLLGVPVERRPVGLVFQKPLLFPHLSVEANVGFGLRMRGAGRREVRAGARAMLERVQLSALAGRRVGELSGGQEQRVALARALVLSPRLLLLDEPFSQLDAALRAEMRALVRGLADEAGLTTLFVTHDQAEAVEVADDVALVLGGRLAGHAPPRAFFTAPPSLAAARFFGVTNEVTGRVTSGLFTAAGLAGPVATGAADGPGVLVVRPESLRLNASDAPPGGLQLRGRVTATRFAGTHLLVEVTAPDGAALRVHAPVARQIACGATALVTAAAGECTVFTGSGA